MKRPHILVIALVLVGLSACAGQRRVGGPVIAVPKDGNQDARNQFEAEKNRFEQDGADSSKQALVFESIVREYPDDPIVPHARLYGGMALYRADQPEEALAQFEKIGSDGVDPLIQNRAELFKGLSLAKLGRHQEGIDSILRGRSAENPKDPVEQAHIESNLAYAYLGVNQPVVALPHFDAWYRVGQGADKAMAAQEIQTLAYELEPSDADDALRSLPKKDGPAAAYLSTRLYREAFAAGDTERAKELYAIATQANQSIGEEPLPAMDEKKGDPNRIGTLLPLTGKLNRVGNVLSRGVGLAMSKDNNSSLEIDSEDSHSTNNVDQEMAALIAANVIAVIGPFDFRAVIRGIEFALKERLPMISLTPIQVAEDGQNLVFHIRHSAEERAKALAKAAVAKGVKAIAIMAPESRYGNTVAKAFESELKALGGEVVVNVRYATDTTSFGDTIESMEGEWQGIFIPDLARKLELIAPALAVADFYTRPVGKRARAGRPILLLSTAEGLSEEFAKRAGRYSWGALLAPGFYADRTDEVIAKFVTSYRAANGRSPGSHEAYAYDATMAVRKTLENGAQSRHEVANGLVLLDEPGVTGRVKFGPEGRRFDGGLLFQVERARRDQYELKAQR